jgi:hypothetical protein
MFVLLVSYKGKEVFRKLFHRRSEALDWFAWRVRAMRTGSAKHPGDQVMVATMEGVVVAAEGEERNVRTG